MNFDKVHKELIKEIPKLKPFYDKALKRSRGCGILPHSFEDVLNPYLLNLLAINEDRELLSRIFNFLKKWQLVMMIVKFKTY